MTPPLRIGILGAARIADDGIVQPAGVLGHALTAVAARDRSRAETFAAERDVRTVHDSYAEVIADPDVDLVYDALVNSLHEEWNIAALRAGKHVLSEKPLTSNAEQTRRVCALAAESPGRLFEGFHYLHHPVNHALRDAVTSGRLGSIRHVEIVLAIPGPPDSDPRWSLELAGGATMDLGCYVLSAARAFGSWIGGDPVLGAVEVTLKGPDMDAAMEVDVSYPGGITGRLVWDMNAADRTMTWTVSGTDGTAVSPAFAVPHLDNRLLLSGPAGSSEQPHGDLTSYTYQLQAVAETIRTGAPFAFTAADSIATAELIDECYAKAGLPRRGV
ncbi:gfo/Idh/MocA family oxidoreductase [Nakamurella sp. YIM 132087]|uniref:Gfo/Idh/MocA family oxidoreductase n=1 Tax=Nakamurella alba TaxID=2665158 RepID=A0A7K1FLN5_9ACTN|nr:Gfo/Idh/MocA family oxidoreductase [Nakamurella alba]MTD15018.1 gfo/Idh/MocA family oxidoreductase [Nakamurella alba]